MSLGPGELEIVDLRDGDVLCLALAGEVDISTAPRLPVRVREALREGVRNVCVDLTAVRFMDSTGLASLLHCQRSVARANGRLAVVHDGGEVLKLIELSRIEQALEMHTSRDAALGSFNGTVA